MNETQLIGNIYFVDEVDGKDSNDGLTPESAFKNLSHANSVAASNLDAVTDDPAIIENDFPLCVSLPWRLRILAIKLLNIMSQRNGGK